MAKKNVRDIRSERDVIMGDQVNITYALKMAGYEPPPDLQQLRLEYLEHLKRSYRALDFKGIPQLESFSRELLLEDVYVPLVARPELPAGETWERRLAGRMWRDDALPSPVDLLPMGEGPGSALSAVEGVGAAEYQTCPAPSGNPERP